jgi:hypothetical protein
MVLEIGLRLINGIAALDLVLLFGLWAGIRGMQATIKYHSLAHDDRAGKPYDTEKWNALIKYDKDIAMVAQKIQPLGEKWMSEFARAFLALNDKRYLPDIVQRIIAEAREEADRAR